MRLFFTLAGLVSVFTFSWWMTMFFVVALAVPYRAWEAIVIGMLLDLVWLPSGALVHQLPLCTLASIIIVWVLEPLRSEFLAAR
jgi:hypothetical protein